MDMKQKAKNWLKSSIEDTSWHFITSEILSFTEDGEPYSRVDVMARTSGERRYIYTDNSGVVIHFNQAKADKLAVIFDIQALKDYLEIFKKG